MHRKSSLPTSTPTEDSSDESTTYCGFGVDDWLSALLLFWMCGPSIDLSATLTVVNGVGIIVGPPDTRFVPTNISDHSTIVMNHIVNMMCYRY